MKIEKIKPIPQKMIAQIKSTDKRINLKTSGTNRYYAYLTKNDRELVKVTVAVKEHKGKWYCKQVAMHGVHSDICFVKDFLFTYMGGYSVGWYEQGLSKTPNWYEDPEWGYCNDKYLNPHSHLMNPEYAYKCPEYKYSACELYKGDDIIEYLRIYEKYPQAEILVKLGLSRFVHSKQVLDKLGKDKSFRKWIVKHHTEISAPDFYVSALFSAYKQNISPKQAQALERAKIDLKKSRYKSISDLIGEDTAKFYSYVAKQEISCALYKDYLEACNNLNLDMNEDKNRYPHDFKYWHDTRIDEYNSKKAILDAEKRKELYENFAKVATKYTPMQETSNGAYVVYIAKSPAELIAEGKAMDHCVGQSGYDQKFVREESLIFFLRSATDTEKPLVTIEFSLKTKSILQCYAYHNSTPDNSVIEYVNKIWLPTAKKALNKIAA